MRRTLVISFLVLSLLGHTQGNGSIQGFVMTPAFPTTTDTIKVMASLQFPYSDCDMDAMGISLAGNTYLAYSHHCIGILTAICNITDTFVIDPPHTAGTYTFDLTLTSGAAPAPCTPGFVPDDRDSVMFVINDVSVVPILPDDYYVLYPNPARTHLSVKGLYDRIEITDLNGKVLITHERPQEDIELIKLEPGFYFCRIYQGMLPRVYRLQKL